MLREYYRLEQSRFSQYEYAFYEAADDSKYGDFQKCPKCEGPISMRKWLAPRKVHLKQCRRIGDLIFGDGGGDFLVSEKLKKSYEKSSLKGIKEFNPVEIVSIRPKAFLDSLLNIKFFEAVIIMPPIRVLFDQMEVKWACKPSAKACNLCGPGGGGKNGQYESYKKIIIDPNHNIDTDIFFPINLCGTIILSSKAYEFFTKNSFKNVFLTPCSGASLSFG
ncbi:MAG: hypothetical protein ACYSUK_12845, partial [Planctomycetota bacterium]